MIRSWIVISALILLGFLTPGQAKEVSNDPLFRSYRLEADFSSWQSGKVEARMELTLENRGETEVGELVFLLYPNRFRQPLPNLNDLNYPRVYPHGFSRGSLDMDSVRVNGTEVEMNEGSVSGLPAETVGKIKLPRRLVPGGQIKVELAFQLVLPRKLGSFGIYDEVLTLAGGWYPYLAAYLPAKGFRPQDSPPLGNWEVFLKNNHAVLLNGKMFNASPSGFEAKLEQRRQLSLQISSRFERYEHRGADRGIVIYYSTLSRKPARESLEAFIRLWLEFVAEKKESLKPAHDLVLVEAPLRESLVAHGEGFSFFSDRAYKLIPLLRQYHNVPIAAELFYQQALPETRKRENSRDYNWVAEAVAASWTETFIAWGQYRYLDARTLPPVRFFSFVPIIDRVIHSPQFAFFDVFYDFIYPYDPVRDHPLRFNHRRPYGRTILSHLEDEIGKDQAAEIGLSYLGRKQASYVDLAEKTSGKSLRHEFDRWISPRPAINYVLDERRTIEQGEKYHHEVTIKRESHRPFAEPVELGVKTRKGKAFALRWDDEKEEHVFRFETDSKLSVVEIDPRRRLLETRLSDNRSPPYYKLVLTEILVGYDFNNNNPEVLVSSQLRRKYGGYNRYNLSGSVGDQTYGVSIGYSRLFGRMIDRLRMGHGLGVSFRFHRLGNDLAAVQPTDGSDPVAVEVGPDGFDTSLSVNYSFGNQLSFTNPLSGGGGGVSVTWGSSYFGGEYDYYRVSFGSSWVIPIHPNHLFAVRGFLGVSGPSGIPSQAQFHLGGLYGLRGLSVGDDTRIGRNMFLASAEYRHFMIKDIDLDFLLFRIRDIQGALFTGLGSVSDTVQERADRLVNGPSSGSSSFGDLFDLSSFSADAGYGLRFHIEYLGVSPGLLRIDLAQDLGNFRRNLRVYFGVTQSF